MTTKATGCHILARLLRVFPPFATTAAKGRKNIWGGGGGLLRNCLNCDSTVTVTYSFNLPYSSSDWCIAFSAFAVIGKII